MGTLPNAQFTFDGVAGDVYLDSSGVFVFVILPSARGVDFRITASPDFTGDLPGVSSSCSSARCEVVLTASESTPRNLYAYAQGYLLLRNRIILARVVVQQSPYRSVFRATLGIDSLPADAERIASRSLTRALGGLGTTVLLTTPSRRHLLSNYTATIAVDTPTRDDVYRVQRAFASPMGLQQLLNDSLPGVIVYSVEAVEDGQALPDAKAVWAPLAALSGAVMSFLLFAIF